jgi:hypothetical protein
MQILGVAVPYTEMDYNNYDNNYNYYNDNEILLEGPGKVFLLS